MEKLLAVLKCEYAVFCASVVTTHQQKRALWHAGECGCAVGFGRGVPNLFPAVVCPNVQGVAIARNHSVAVVAAGIDHSVPARRYGASRLECELLAWVAGVVLKVAHHVAVGEGCGGFVVIGARIAAYPFECICLAGAVV